MLWLTLPPRAGLGTNPRVERFNAMVAQIAASRPWMAQPDYAGYLAALSPDRDPRPDGMHVTMGTAGSVWEEWLNAVVLDTARSR